MPHLFLPGALYSVSSAGEVGEPSAGEGRSRAHLETEGGGAPAAADVSALGVTLALCFSWVGGENVSGWDEGEYISLSVDEFMLFPAGGVLLKPGGGGPGGGGAGPDV